MPIKGLDDKRQITGTFAVSLTGHFLPIQVIYQGKMQRSLPKHKFSHNSGLIPTNQWSILSIPSLRKSEEEKGYPDEQGSLMIMDTFKGQDNNVLKTLCEEYHCVVVLVPNNLTNKFQPLDISVNKPATSNKFNVVCRPGVKSTSIREESSRCENIHKID